jgi:hypothetical protein
MFRSVMQLAAIFAGVFALGLVVARPAAAQTESEHRGALQREFRELFDRTMADPTNLDLAFRYAEVAAQLGDFEAAITALERMLFFNPDLPRVKLELGVLYFRLGSFAEARRYFEQAVEGGAVPDEVRARVAVYLSEIDRLSSPHRFAGQLFGGIQHQTNANLAPGSARAAPLGVVLPVTLSEQFAKKADQNVFASGTFLYSYDLGTQQRDTLETAATLFQSKYFRVHRLDLGIAEVTVGPRVGLGRPVAEGATVRPYAIGNWVELGRNPFFHTLGAGVELTYPVTQMLLLRPTYEHRVKNYSDAGDRPTSRELTGADDIVTLTASLALGGNSLLTVSLTGINEDTRFAFDTNREYGGTAAYQITYGAPFGVVDAPWTTSFVAGRSYTLFDAPNPTIDPDVTRFDRRWRFGIAQTFGLTAAIDLVVQLQRDIVSSTLPNFAFTNSSILLGPQLRF